MTEYEKLSLRLQLITAWGAVLMLQQPSAAHPQALAGHRESVAKLSDVLQDAQDAVEAAIGERPGNAPA